MRNPLLSLGLTLCTGVLLMAPLGCSDDDDPVEPDPDPVGAVQVNFATMVGEHPLVFDESNFTTEAGNVFEVSSLEYYISDIKFVGPDGTAEIAGVHYVNGRDHDTHTMMVHNIPARHYHKVMFTFGLSDEKNVSGAVPDAEGGSSMAWPPTNGGGYHYMKMNGKFQNGSETAGFHTHAGRLDSGSKQESHFFESSGDLHENVVDGETFEITISMDILEWYKSPNTIDLGDHNAIMQDFDKQAELQENGANVFGVEVVYGDGGGHGHEG